MTFKRHSRSPNVIPIESSCLWVDILVVYSNFRRVPRYKLFYAENHIFAYPTCIWPWIWRSYRWNAETKFGARKTRITGLPYGAEIMITVHECRLISADFLQNQVLRWPAWRTRHGISNEEDLLPPVVRQQYTASKNSFSMFDQLNVSGTESKYTQTGAFFSQLMRRPGFRRIRFEFTIRNNMSLYWSLKSTNNHNP